MGILVFRQNLPKLAYSEYIGIRITYGIPQYKTQFLIQPTWSNSSDSQKTQLVFRKNNQRCKNIDANFLCRECNVLMHSELSDSFLLYLSALLLYSTYKDVIRIIKCKSNGTLYQSCCLLKPQIQNFLLSEKTLIFNILCFYNTIFGVHRLFAICYKFWHLKFVNMFISIKLFAAYFFKISSRYLEKLNESINKN